MSAPVKPSVCADCYGSMSRKPSKSSKGRPVVVDGDFTTASDGLSGNRVFVSMAKTINLGNYESLRVEFGEGRTVKDGQQFSEVKMACKKGVMVSLKEMVDIVEGQKR